MGRLATLLLLGMVAGCGAAEYRATLTLVGAAENLPCSGLRRLRINVFHDETHGTGRDLFGQFYDEAGGCNLPAGLPVELSGLQLTNKMWVLVEGFDSTEKRRLATAETAIITKGQVQSGDLGELVLEREPVQGQYRTTSLVITDLPGLPALEPVEELVFNINYGTPDSINGAFFRNPNGSWLDGPLVISNLAPRNDNKILVVASRKDEPTPLGTWEQQGFDIPDGALFVELQPQAQ